jgi:hypothetical protein
MYWGVFNSVALFILLRPLTKQEISMQWKKRKMMGKWLYSLYHLEGQSFDGTASDSPKSDGEGEEKPARGHGGHH